MANCLGAEGYMHAEQAKFDAHMYAARMRKTAAAIIAIDNAARAVSNYRQQHDVADRALDVAEAQRRHAQTTYWPLELDFMEEFANPRKQWRASRTWAGATAAG